MLVEQDESPAVEHITQRQWKQSVTNVYRTNCQRFIYWKWLRDMNSTLHLKRSFISLSLRLRAHLISPTAIILQQTVPASLVSSAGVISVYILCWWSLCRHWKQLQAIEAASSFIASVFMVFNILFLHSLFWNCTVWIIFSMCMSNVCTAQCFSGRCSNVYQVTDTLDKLFKIPTILQTHWKIDNRHMSSLCSF